MAIRIKVWIGEALEPSLLMSFLLVSLVTTAAVHDGIFNLAFYILAIVGVTSTERSKRSE